MIQKAIEGLVEGRSLSKEEVGTTVKEIAEGTATQTQIAGLLVALRQKGETPEEIAAFAEALRRYSVRIRPSVSGRLIDTCGTGGDRVKTFNVSTVSALVAAGAGVKVAKHGNRSVTSRCGSADLLERLGFNLSVAPQKVQGSIERVGIGFMFAPLFHPAMKQVAPVRKELGMRTIFNVMGPLINPAGVAGQTIGVYARELVPKITSVLGLLGCEEAMVYHALEGMDEISASGKTVVAHLKDGVITETEIDPRELGIIGEADSVQVADVEESASIALGILSGRAANGARNSIVLINSAAAIVVGGLAATLDEGLPVAKESIESGAAMKKLEELVRYSGGDLSRIEVYAKN